MLQVILLIENTRNDEPTRRFCRIKPIFECFQDATEAFLHIEIQVCFHCVHGAAHCLRCCLSRRGQKAPQIPVRLQMFGFCTNFSVYGISKNEDTLDNAQLQEHNGCRKHGRIEEHLLTAKNDKKCGGQNRSSKSAGVDCRLDLSKAFDRIDWDMLREALAITC